MQDLLYDVWTNTNKTSGIFDLSNTYDIAFGLPLVMIMYKVKKKPNFLAVFVQTKWRDEIITPISEKQSIEIC